jgi:hypothetical protein
MPTVTGEVHRPQARFSPVNFTEYPRFLMPANKAAIRLSGLHRPSPQRNRRKRKREIVHQASAENTSCAGTSDPA